MSEGKKVMTSVVELKRFYPAEEYHQNYWNVRGAETPYCKIIPGKLAKLKEHFK